MKTDIKCSLCKAEQPLFKAILKSFGANGWEEQTILVCKKCMKSEGLVELKEEVKAA